MTRIRAYGLLLAFVLLIASSAGAEVNPEAAAQAPLKFYQAVNAKNYAAAWGLLTEASKSRLTILVAEDAKQTPAEIRNLFDSSDPRIQAGFWDSFRGSAKPELYVTFAYKYTGDKAGSHVIQASDPGSQNGKTLDLVVKDEGGYKFGLVETYGI